MGGNAFAFQHGHEPIAHLVVDDPFADDGSLLQTVEGRGIILIGHDQKFGILCGKDLLCFPLVELLFLFH